MSGTTPQIDWFIARDGTRHGPISDAEMRKFVELGHLKPTDLVWCQRFSEWQLASQVFGAGLGQPQPAASVPVQPAAPIASAPVPAAARADHSMAGQPHASVAADARPSPAAAGPVANESQAVHAPQQQVLPSNAIATGPGPALSDDAVWASAMRAVLEEPARQNQGRLQAQPQGVERRYEHGLSAYEPAVAPSPAQAYRPQHPQADKRTGMPAQAPQGAYEAGSYASPQYAPAGYQPQQAAPGFAGQTGLDYEDERAGQPKRARRDWISVTAGAAAVLLILGGLGWVGWQNRTVVAGAAAIGNAIKSKVSSTPSPEAFRMSPYEAPGETKDLIDVSLQRAAIWRVLKRDHPEWYGERLADIERMRNEKREEKVIARFLADVIITLRRRNALTALQSSPEHLRGMSRMFAENLRQLASRDGSTCFAFITYGEANPFSLELSRTPAFAETLQRQLVSIFEAIADGKANRNVHPNTQRADYDRLTKDLMARGWSSSDLATFSDPQKLSSSPPDKVCTLVQEWFATHLAITDKELQTRLLAESLKPLVGG